MKKIYNLFSNFPGYKIGLTFVLFLFSFSFSLKAQTFLKTVIVGDTIKLSVTSVTGSIQWQECTDSLNWTDMAGFTNSFETFIATTSPSGKKFYRAKITDTLCPNGTPFYSSIIRNKIVANTTEVVVGNWFHGGIVFYTDGSGNGLIAPQQNQSSGVKWGCYGTSISGAVSITDGAANTAAIMAACATRPIAASICDSLTINGYNDWFLPAQNQLNYLYQQRSLVGGFSTYNYWSSSEYNANYAWAHNFGNGIQNGYHKDAATYVKCVRPFSNIDINPIVLPEIATITGQPVTVELTTQPANQVKCKGSSVTFTVAASSTTVFYQWKKGGISISNASNANYTLSNLTTSDEGIYSCEVFNLCGSITSNNAELIVIDLNVNAGTDFTFCNDTITHLTAIATTNHTTESGTLNYSWTPTATLGSPTSVTTTAHPTSNTTYTISVTDQVGCTKTDAIVVTSKTPVSITTQPLSYNKCLNSNVTFTLNATGTAPITYVWKKNGTPISGVTSNSFSINNLGLSEEGIYTCEPTNYCRTLVSNNAELKVIDLNVDAGADFTFCNDTITHLIANATTNHTELGSLNYSWSPTTTLGSSTSSTTTAQPTSNTNYTISVTDQLGCSKTDTIIVTSSTPVDITTQPLSYNKCLNSNVTFTISSSGTEPIIYQWKHDGNDINGANSNTHEISSLSLFEEGIYTCNISNYCNNLQSNNSILKVVELILEAGSDEHICNNSSIGLLASASTNHSAESGTLNYTWSPLTGLSSTVVNNPDANPTVTTNYTVTVSDQLGCSDTDSVQVFVQNVFQDEEICLVTVDVNTWKNKIMCGKTAGMGTAGYNIYKEVGTNIYSGIGYVAFSNSSEYIDYSSNPESYSNRYKITAVDTCGAESTKSFFHKSINLTIAAFGSTMGLNWNDYIDESGLFVPVNYFIFKGTSPLNMQLIDSVPGGTNSYNDNNVFNLYYYIVGVKKENGCNTAKSSLVSFSNKKDNSVFIGINSITSEDSKLNVSPNPFNESTTISFKNSEKKSFIVSIADLTGKIVRIYKNITTEKLVIEKEELQSGVYFVEVSGEKKYRGKLVIE